MSCEYCRGDIALMDYSKPSHKSIFGSGAGIDIYVCDGELSVTSMADTYEPSLMEADVTIKYCPMCGERFNTDNT